MDYQSTYERSLADPGGFWAEAAHAIDWDVAPVTVLDDSAAPFYRWFTDGVLNTCYNALDRHADGGLGENVALVYDSPVTGEARKYSFSALRREVALLAGALQSLGVARGDRVIIYMPMVPEAVMAMLACARIGAVHSVVFGGFAAHELAVRVDAARPKVILAASCGIEPGKIIEYQPLVEAALEIANHRPEAVVILQRPQAPAQLLPGRDHDWHELVENAEPAGCVPLAATDPLYILYTSGTTGAPKGVVRDNGGHAVALAWTMKHIYGVAPGEVFWGASDIGWIVGHTHIVYGALIAGCTTVLYEGKPVGTPDSGAFWRVASEYGASIMLTAPTAIRAIMREDADGGKIAGYDLSSLRALFLSGERCDVATMCWAETKLGVPVIDHFGQTECCWPMIANPLGIEPMAVKPGSVAKPVPGFDVTILDESGQVCPAGEIGALVVKLPLPPGTLATLWEADDRYREVYLERYPGYFLGGDAAFRDDDGYFWIVGRNDDVINVAGHRLSTRAIEEVIAGHGDVADCAVVGVTDDLKGQLPLGLVVPVAGSGREPAELATELVAAVRDRIGPVAAFKRVVVVERLPKTRSGKIVTGALRRIANGEELPADTEQPAVLEEIAEALIHDGRMGDASGFEFPSAEV